MRRIPYRHKIARLTGKQYKHLLLSTETTTIIRVVKEATVQIQGSKIKSHALFSWRCSIETLGTAIKIAKEKKCHKKKDIKHCHHQLSWSHNNRIATNN